MVRLTHWLRNWVDRIHTRWELNSLDAGELARIAHDMGLSSAELVAVNEGNPDVAERLPRLMDVLHLDPAGVSRTHPEVFRDLQRVCTKCGSIGRCVRDLDDGTAVKKWESYCPNASTLRALIQEFHRRKPMKSATQPARSH
jgi:uncharacterized protein YjiS (DUF1127 family)